MLKNTAEGDPAVFFVCHKTTHPPARAALPFKLADAFSARRLILLVLVDLDIAGLVFILNKQQGGGQGHRQSSEDGEQCFENFHGLKPPWKSLARSGGRSAVFGCP